LKPAYLSGGDRIPGKFGLGGAPRLRSSEFCVELPASKTLLDRVSVQGEAITNRKGNSTILERIEMTLRGRGRVEERRKSSRAFATCHSRGSHPYSRHDPIRFKI